MLRYCPMLSLSVLILAGGPSRCDVSVATGKPVHALPLAFNVSLVDGWHRSLRENVDGYGAVDLASVTVILSGDSAPDASVMTLESSMGLGCVREPRQHRGTAGVVADQILKDSDRADALILVIEASASPVVDLGPMFARASSASRGSQACVIGESELGRYCGVCMCDRESFGLVPEIGFFDLKEQFLPLLRSTGRKIESVTIAPRALRLRSRADWLAIVEVWASRTLIDGEAGMGDFGLAPSSGHREDGVCVIEPGAVTRGAIISSSIIMAGAVVEPGAVVARSVVGPGAVIAADSVVVDAVVPARQIVESRRSRSSGPAGARRQKNIIGLGGS